MILDCNGKPVKVEPIPDAPKETAFERNQREAAKRFLASLGSTRWILKIDL